jgi:hypothetical protein
MIMTLAGFFKHVQKYTKMKYTWNSWLWSVTCWLLHRHLTSSDHGWPETKSKMEVSSQPAIRHHRKYYVRLRSIWSKLDVAFRGCCNSRLRKLHLQFWNFLQVSCMKTFTWRFTISPDTCPYRLLHKGPTKDNSKPFKTYYRSNLTRFQLVILPQYWRVGWMLPLNITCEPTHESRTFHLNFMTEKIRYAGCLKHQNIGFTYWAVRML